jgi:hypothetical protein
VEEPDIINLDIFSESISYQSKSFVSYFVFIIIIIIIIIIIRS